MSYKKSSKSTTSITPNWFQNLFTNKPEVGQENQFTSTRGLRYGPLRINKTGIFVNNGTLDSTIITSSGFHGYGLTGSEQITLDASTGVNVTDGTNSVFKAEISGTNVGDVTIGAYDSGAGVFYDKSAGTFTIKGTLSAVGGTFSGSISIGSGDNIFKADSNGIYLGDSTFADAPFRVTMAGALTATNATISGSITSTSGTIGGWTIGATTLSGTSVSLDSSGSILVGSATAGISMLMSGGVPYIAFVTGSAVKGLLKATTAGNGGANLMGGDFVIDNNYSVLLTSSGGYGGISVTSGQQFWLTLGSNNTFYIKNFAQNDNYFTVSNDRAYHKAEFQANKFTSNSGNLVLDAEGSNKVKLESNLDMNEKDIDACDTVWAYHFNTRSEVFKGEPFSILNSLESTTDKSGWSIVNHEKLHKDILTINDKGEKGYSLDRLIEIQRIAILQLKDEVDKLKIKSL